MKRITHIKHVSIPTTIVAVVGIPNFGNSTHLLQSGALSIPWVLEGVLLIRLRSKEKWVSSKVDSSDALTLQWR